MSKKKIPFQLTKGQAEVIDMIVEWYCNDESEDFTVGGYAGVGKTSILPIIVDKLGLSPDEVLYVAYTGKAASVLMQKGFTGATTIHSAFYDLVETPKVRGGEIILKNGRVVKEHQFREKDFIDPHIKLIVVDEWSMVNEELAHAIFKHGIPIIAMGDPCQLRPIYGESPFASRIRYTLTEITRQAQYSGIVQLATAIREGEELPYYCNYFNDAWVMPKELMTEKHMLDADIILTAKNKTRTIFNNKIRELHGSFGKLPNVGDKLVCRKNCWYRSLNSIPLINGTLGKMVHPIRMDECNLSRGIYRIDFQPDFVFDTDICYEALPCDYDYLKAPCGEKEINEFNRGVKLEFAEAITTWLAQGSQYRNVLYYDEWVGDRDLMKQLRYTSVTRATDKVIMFI